jgi:hypothetical protein
LRYQPVSAAIRGRIVAKVFAGPPEYESVKRGDVAESLFVLRPTRPVCVELDPARSDPEVDATPERNVREIQLDLSRVCTCVGGIAGRAIQYYGATECVKRVPRLRALGGSVVTAHGVLRHSIVGHDHTDVIFVIDSLPGVRSTCKDHNA